MARTIWKFPVPITDRFGIRMSVDAHVLTVQVQDGQPCLWAEVDPASKAKQHQRRFRIVGTGNPLVEGVAIRYIGTFQMPPFVWHLYEDE